MDTLSIIESGDVRAAYGDVRGAYGDEGAAYGDVRASFAVACISAPRSNLPHKSHLKM